MLVGKRHADARDVFKTALLQTRLEAFARRKTFLGVQTTACHQIKVGIFKLLLLQLHKTDLGHVFCDVSIDYAGVRASTSASAILFVKICQGVKHF